MKTWLKGGLIGAIISFSIGNFGSIIFIIVALMSIGNSHITSPTLIINFIFTIIALPWILALKIRNAIGFFDGLITIPLIFIVSSLIYIIVGFLLAALIGFIIQKIKNK